MADNTTLNAGTGGDTVAMDDIGGVKHQRVKLSLGADGAAVDAVAGAGAVSTAVQRVTLASDDPAVAALEILNVQTADYDTGAGTDTQVMIGIALPASGGAVAGGTATNPVVVAAVQSGTWDEVGINDSGNSITVDNAQLSVVGSGTEATAVRVTIATDSTGVLSVDDNGGTLTVDNAGLTELAAAINASSQLDVNIAASAVSFGGTSAADDADFTDGTTAGTPVMGVYEATPSTVTDGDLGVVGITEDRALKTSVVNTTLAVTQSGTWDEVGIHDSGNSITVDGTVAVTGVSTVAEQQTQTTALQLIDDIVHVDDTATHATGTTKGALIMAAATPTDGSVSANDIGAVAMTVDRKLHVAVMDALPAGTAAIGKLAANSGVDIGDVDVTSLPALAAGTAYVGKTLPPDRDVTLHTAYAKKYYTNAGAATDGIIWSPAAGTRWHVVALFINISAAATITLEDDKAGGDEAVMKMELAANSGIMIPFPEHYPLASGEDAADLIITTTAGNVYVTAVGYEI